MCFLYEGGLNRPYRDKSHDAPAKISAAFGRFDDRHSRDMMCVPSLHNSSIRPWGHELSTAIGQDLPAIKRNVLLKQALPALITPNEKLAPNSPRQPQSRFNSRLQRFKFPLELSSKIAVAWDLKLIENKGRIEANQYLHLPGTESRRLLRLACKRYPLVVGLSTTYLPRRRWHSPRYISDQRERPGAEHAAQIEPQKISKICFGYVRTGSIIASLPCSHWFHEKCIVAWLQEINTCPTCDAEVYEEDISEPISPAPELGLA